MIIKGKLELYIKNIVPYDAEDVRLPSTFCCTCKRNIYKSFEDDSKKIVGLPNFCHLKPMKRTRLNISGICNCQIC